MNKTLIFSAYFAFINCSYLMAQSDPVVISFVEAQPLWEHLVYDTSFYEIGNQPDINKYTVVKPHQSVRFNDDLFLSNYCTNHRAEFYGYILERLNIRTGEILWQNYSTYYNGGLQDHYKNLFVRPDGGLEMAGIKRHGPYLNTGFAYWNTGGGKSNFVRKVFDYESGELEQTIIGQDSIDFIIPSYLNHYAVEVDSMYFVAELTGKQSNGSIGYGVDFYVLNEKHNLVDSLPVGSILYETSDSVNVFSFGQPQFLEYLDDSTMVTLIFQDWGEIGKTKAQLIWFNIKDVYNIQVIKRLNIESLIPGYFQSMIYFRFDVENELIYISHHYPDESMEQYWSYLICLDRNGELVHHIIKCESENHNYQALRLIYSNAEYDYFAAFKSYTNRDGFDILKLNRGSNELQFVNSLTSAYPGEEFTRQMEVSRVYNDGIFIIGAYTLKEGLIQNSAVKYYAFDAKDLGMDILSRQEGANLDHTLVAYPNPTQGSIILDFGMQISGHIRLVNSLGVQMDSYTFYNLDKYSLNLAHVPSGIYYVVIIEDAKSLSRTVKIVFAK